MEAVNKRTYLRANYIYFKTSMQNMGIFKTF